MRFFFAYLLLGIIAVVYARPLNDPRRDLIIESRTHWYVRSQGDTNAKANGVNGHANGVNGHTNGVQALQAERPFIVLIGDAGDIVRGRSITDPPVPRRIQERLEAYFLRDHYFQCDIRFTRGTAYMLQDVEAAFTFQYQWHGMPEWEDGNLARGE
ncbi:hypothetical protein GGU10DRAFT_338170 [Lentinula aff. detonsa]|uniref:Uncharacterized protein n=1 Tax=Lentinula aff. detonsa TaxID=2804958 RepID=A0AA38NUB1_9AGAR|nr:hypothetical protein GGU10DRAFT_338170 [Lentinula aff. detonsa]